MSDRAETSVQYALRRVRETGRSYIVTSWPPGNGKVWPNVAGNRKLAREFGETFTTYYPRKRKV